MASMALCVLLLLMTTLEPKPCLRSDEEEEGASLAPLLLVLPQSSS